MYYDLTTNRKSFGLNCFLERWTESDRKRRSVVRRWGTRADKKGTVSSQPVSWFPLERLDRSLSDHRVLVLHSRNARTSRCQSQENAQSLSALSPVEENCEPPQLRHGGRSNDSRRRAVYRRRRVIARQTRPWGGCHLARSFCCNKCAFLNCSIRIHLSVFHGFLVSCEHVED